MADGLRRPRVVRVAANEARSRLPLDSLLDRSQVAVAAPEPQNHNTLSRRPQFGGLNRSTVSAASERDVEMARLVTTNAALRSKIEKGMRARKSLQERIVELEVRDGGRTTSGDTL